MLRRAAEDGPDKLIRGMQPTSLERRPITIPAWRIEVEIEVLNQRPAEKSTLRPPPHSIGVGTGGRGLRSGTRVQASARPSCAGVRMHFTHSRTGACRYQLSRGAVAGRPSPRHEPSTEEGTQPSERWGVQQESSCGDGPERGMVYMHWRVPTSQNLIVPS